MKGGTAEALHSQAFGGTHSPRHSTNRHPAPTSTQKQKHTHTHARAQTQNQQHTKIEPLTLNQGFSAVVDDSPMGHQVLSITIHSFETPCGLNSSNRATRCCLQPVACRSRGIEVDYLHNWILRDSSTEHIGEHSFPHHV